MTGAERGAVPLVVARHDPRYAAHVHAYLLHQCICPRAVHPALGHWPDSTVLACIHHVLGCRHHPDTPRTPCPYAGCEPRLIVLRQNTQRLPGGIVRNLRTTTTEQQVDP